MERDSITAACEQARSLVEDIKDEPYHAIAFEVLFRQLLGGVGQVPVPVEASVPQPNRAQAMDISIGEFLAVTQPKTYPDRVVAIALYHLRTRSEDSVTRPDILESLSKARVPKPKNLSDVIAQAVRKGHLMDSDSKDGQKSWKITTTGERYIEEKLVRRG